MSVNLPNGDSTDYTYGAEGQRLIRVENAGGVETITLYLGDAVEIVNHATPSEVVHW